MHLGRAVDARTDIYSLGATLYFLLTGKPPYEAEAELHTAFRHLADPVPQSSELPLHVNALIAHMMAKDAPARPPNADTVREAVQRCCDAMAGDCSPA